MKLPNIGLELSGSSGTSTSHTAAVLGENIWEAWPSSFGRQQRLSEIAIEPINNQLKIGGLGNLCPPAPTTVAGHVEDKEVADVFLCVCL